MTHSTKESSTKADPVFSIQKVDSYEGFLALEREWKDLQAPLALANLGSSFDVLNSLFKTIGLTEDNVFGYQQKLRILLVRNSDNRIVAIAPLVKVLRDRKVGPFTKAISSIEFLGHPSMHVFFRFFRTWLTKEPGVNLTKAIIDWLYANETFDVVHLAFIHETEKEHFPESAKYCVATNPSSIVEIGNFSDFDAYARLTLGRSLKQNLRTTVNRCAKMGVQIKTSRELVDANSLQKISQLTEFTPDGWSYREGGFDAFRQDLCLSHKAEVVFVYVDGEPQAYRLYVHYGGGKFEIETMVHMKYRQLGLGAQMIEGSIRASFDDQLSEHCEGLFGGFHTQRFSSRELNVYKYLRAGNTFCAQAADSLLNMAKFGIQDVQKIASPSYARKL